MKTDAVRNPLRGAPVLRVFSRYVLSGGLLALLFVVPVYALEPSEVLVVANRFVSGSVDLARYYMDRRGIPRDRLLKVTTSEKETISRALFDKEIVAPIRTYLKKNDHAATIKVIVTIKGVPLRVTPPALSAAEKQQLQLLNQQKDELQGRLKSAAEQDPDTAKDLKHQIDELNKRLKVIKKGDYAAAVDSELTLVATPDYDLKFWQPNPYFVPFQNQNLKLKKNDVLFVSRLDGPTVELVKRMIDDGLAAESKGLSGTAYLDARWQRKDRQQLSGYALYDQSIHLAAERIRHNRPKMKIVIDRESRLFQPGEAPNAALYCGWYSLAHYVDAFDWVPGAVGYHIASQECQSLRSGSGQYWCKRMLEDGAAAVIGPVSEPYVQSFPLPELFFHYLTHGYYTLVEAYFLSLPYLSWQMILVGDPLYHPFQVGQ